MWPFFVLWDFWFWLFFGIFIILEFVWTNKSNGIAGLVTPFGFLLALFLFSSFNPFSWIADNWKDLWIYGLGYVIIGLAWSFFHWLRFVQKRADYLGEFLDCFRKNNDKSPDWFPKEQLTGYLGKEASAEARMAKKFWEDLSNNWYETFPSDRFVRSFNATFDGLVPQAINNKDNLVAWMSLWPFDMFWMLLSDFMIEMWNWLFSRFRLAYQNIANRAFRKYVLVPSSKKEDQIDEAK